MEELNGLHFADSAAGQSSTVKTSARDSGSQRSVEQINSLVQKAEAYSRLST